jgi:two-component system sensor histidine kinase DegS
MADQPTSLRDQLDRELEGLERELAEMALLVEQARTEAARHEQKRSQAAERVAGLAASGRASEAAEASASLITLTRRAAIMESQVDVVAGKQRTLERYRDGLARVRDALADGGSPLAVEEAPPEPGPVDPGGHAAAPRAGRAVLSAQEELRREIARALHDGPAQSLANIVLQAQIVDRLVEDDPAAAREEVRELVAMVQRTLETTKTFIFDVRPMVLDDLGLVPTLRRTAREHSRRAGIPVSFDSAGTDRRLTMDLESEVFRIAEEAIEGLLAGGPATIALALDWGEAELTLTIRAEHPISPERIVEEARPDMPQALRAMVDERRAREAARDTIGGLDAARRRVIADRATAVGGQATFANHGRELTARFPVPSEATS